MDSETPISSHSDLTILRTIHPVGQGAFYSEQFFSEKDSQPLYSVVYDCGSSNDNQSALEKQIEKFESNVDLLFISHFHNDHISGVIDLLSNNNRPCTIVVPGICHSRFVVDLISNYLSTGSISSHSIRFMLQCIPSLKKVNTLSDSIQNRDEEAYSGERLAAHTIIAQSSATTSYPTAASFRWIYDANYTEIDSSKEKDLLNRLSKVIPSLLTILKDTTVYLDAKWYKEHLLPELSKVSLDEIKSTYAEVFGATKHNSYSMMVHSHPGSSSSAKDIDCLYTGDIDIKGRLGALNKATISKLNPHYIQVPHHGSKNNFDGDMYSIHQIAFISVSESSPYGHPSKETLVGLIQKCSYVHIITEEERTRYRRRFRF